MQDLNDLYYFAQVVDHGGFAPAARVLGVPKSRLSRRIILLEERLGVRLLQRSTRRFAVTDIGQDFYRHCVAMTVEAEAAQHVVERTRGEPRGTIRLACPPDLVCYGVGDMIARFMAANRQVGVYLESTGRPVDVIAEGFDLAIRVRFPPLEESDLVMRVLAHSPQRLVAAPGLVAALRQPPVPADLAALPSIDFGPPQGPHRWRLEGPNGETALVTHTPRLVTGDLTQMRLAALQGLGIVQMPTLIVGGDLASDALVDVIPNWRPRTGIVHAIFPSRRGLLPAVRLLLDFLAAEFAVIAKQSEGGLVTMGGAV